MAAAAGNTYTNSTGMMPSFVKAMKLIMQSKTPLFTDLKESKAVQKLHEFYYDRIANPTADNVAIEGEVTTVSAPLDISMGTNYCAIYKRAYGVSGTQEATSFKSIANYLAYQKERAMKQVAMDIEYGLVNGTVASGASGTARAMNGLVAWANTASASTATASSATFGSATGELAFNTLLAAQYANTPIDEPNFVLISPTNKIQLNKWTSTNTRWVPAGDKKLVATIGIYESSFGTIEVFLHNLVGNAYVVGGNMDTLYLAWLRRPFSEPLAKTGDFTQVQVVAVCFVHVQLLAAMRVLC